jgi:hypothetical protein
MHNFKCSCRITLPAIALVGSLLGCTRVPSLQPTTNSIPVYRIVERVKCELIDAIAEELTEARLAEAEHRKSVYSFLTNWDATVDLTLIANDLSAISPGVSLVNPLKQVVDKARGTFSQSFSLGLGGGVSGQAIRTETLSFSLSLKEVQDELRKPALRARYHDCALPNGSDLDSNLGLREWIKSALSPLRPPPPYYDPDYPYLTIGHHPSVHAGGGGPKALKELKDATRTLMETVDKQIGETKRIASVSVQNSRQLLKNALEPESVIENPDRVEEGIKGLKEQGVGSDEITNLKDAVIAKAKRVRAARKAPPQQPKPNPPIDAISHQVQFIVIWNASMTPNWTLVRFKGPAPASGPFASASRTDTHQVLITLGPVTAGAPGGPAAAIRSYQLLNSAIQNLQIRPIQ